MELQVQGESVLGIIDRVGAVFHVIMAHLQKTYGVRV